MVLLIMDQEARIVREQKSGGGPQDRRHRCPKKWYGPITNIQSKRQGETRKVRELLDAEICFGGGPQSTKT